MPAKSYTLALNTYFYQYSKTLVQTDLIKSVSIIMWLRLEGKYWVSMSANKTKKTPLRIRPLPWFKTFILLWSGLSSYGVENAPQNLSFMAKGRIVETWTALSTPNHLFSPAGWTGSQASSATTSNWTVLSLMWGEGEWPGTKAHLGSILPTSQPPPKPAG